MFIVSMHELCTSTDESCVVFLLLSRLFGVSELVNSLVGK